ncbi:MAG TPA: hypothetical protein VJC15_02800 [Candidatus Paceibacterota bacterium]
MKNYAKVGNSTGNAAYRTPSSFRYRHHVDVTKKAASQRPTRSQNLAKRAEHPRAQKLK